MPKQQTQNIDWEAMRRMKVSDAIPPGDWPDRVVPISISGLTLFGIHKDTGDVYWDGHRIETTIRLSGRDRFLAALVAFSTASMAIVDLLRYAWGE
ncbi:hypothetical protein ACIQUB_13945 [Rhizobium sp. NPDC090275]|uniref:hypothetical protein n=1 Tax=Rhizobium sp. NPDC090275 TaxID=3364498 RepID=UPI003839D370